jgi:biuret amidohydrolase
VRAPADYMPEFRPDWGRAGGRTALLLVDLQYATGSRAHGLGRRLQEEGRAELVAQRYERIENLVVPNTRRLLGHFRERGMPVIYLVNGACLPDYSDFAPHMREFVRYVGALVGTKEYEILEEVAPTEQELVVRKTTAGAFHSTSLDRTLRSLGVSSLVVVGISTNACVDTTARGAAELGYETLLVEDACASTHPELHDAALRSFGRLFGTVASTDEALGLVQGSARSLEHRP